MLRLRPVVLGLPAVRPGPASAGRCLAIKAQLQIDKEGTEVAVAAAGTPVSPAGDGKATCAGTTIAMAGALTGPNAALGLNILYGANVAIDEHNKANPGCQVPSSSSTPRAIRRRPPRSPADRRRRQHHRPARTGILR